MSTEMNVGDTKMPTEALIGCEVLPEPPADDPDALCTVDASHTSGEKAALAQESEENNHQSNEKTTSVVALVADSFPEQNSKDVGTNVLTSHPARVSQSPVSAAHVATNASLEAAQVVSQLMQQSGAQPQHPSPIDPLSVLRSSLSSTQAPAAHSNQRFATILQHMVQQQGLQSLIPQLPLLSSEQLHAAQTLRAQLAPRPPSQPIDFVNDDNGNTSSLKRPAVASATDASKRPRTANQPVVAIGRPSVLDTFYDRPVTVTLPPDFKPTLEQLIPPDLPARSVASSRSTSPHTEPSYSYSSGKKCFQLSLLNVNEFTITGLFPDTYYSAEVTPLTGLRGPIKRIAKRHGSKAIFKNGKWYIPLAAYHAFHNYLVNEERATVYGIRQQKLNIASIARNRKEKGYPTAEALIQRGVPSKVAKALAPFQRGGVDFVYDKNGRALIADDMGLGKTIQGIASMAIYHADWPLLVLTPSSARYHWENEFREWLGASQGDDDDGEAVFALQREEINVLTSSKDKVLIEGATKVVICSYGLAPALCETGRIVPGMFQSAIVDESHMLKNKRTKRTSQLLPVLKETTRCVLLSGTPALAKPAELWPQLEILKTDQSGWDQTEEEFMENYAKGGSSKRTELAAMLSATVMIRRLKNNIMKTLPKKQREKAHIHVLNKEQREEFHDLMVQLRESRGQLGDIARKHFKTAQESGDDHQNEEGFNEGVASFPTAEDKKVPALEQNAMDVLAVERDAEWKRQVEITRRGISTQYPLLSVDQQHVILQQYLPELRHRVDVWFQGKVAGKMNEVREGQRTTLLSRMYALTGNAKILLVVDMLKRWLGDPTKGKLCIFAHHINVLDAIQKQAGLNMGAFIRIDGQTSPKARQEQINLFQKDPRYRIALLGITAAGVAVTLTASSTVWFAELFWTPAIMIQAEDRCHRIGQQAIVKCLYFVAKGTLDEMLWKLVEKKFQELGEFVEGKERQKMVVDKDYSNVHELHKIFEDDRDESDGEKDDADEIEGEDTKELENMFVDLQDDIAVIGRDEQQQLITSDDQDDEQGESPPSFNTKPTAVTTITLDDDVGTSQDKAIVLDDTDDEGQDTKPAAVSARAAEAKKSAEKTPRNEDVEMALPTDKKLAAMPASAPVESNSAEKTSRAEASSVVVQSAAVAPSLFSDAYQVYRISFRSARESPRLGLSLELFKGCVVVSKVSEERKQKVGDLPPHVGAILVKVNTQRLATSMMTSQKFDRTIKYFREHLDQGINCIFAQDPTFTEFFQQHLQLKQAATHQPTLPGAPLIIDLLDDDDELFIK